jgi:hypothetical protein
MKKVYFLITLLLVLSFSLKAQSFQWVQPYSSNDYYLTRAVCTDSTGNSYLAGYFLGSLQFENITLQAKGSTDIFIAKYNSEGILQWVQQIGQADGESVSGINTDTEGNIYITGGFGSSLTIGDHNLRGSGETNLFIAKGDSSGNWLWAKGAGGSGKTYGNKVAIDTSGNAYLTGYFTETSYFENTALSSSKLLGQGFIARYNADGSLAWAKPAGITEEGTGIATDKQGFVYLTGYYSGENMYEHIAIPSSGGNDIFLAKYSNSGDLQWVKTAVGENEEIYHYSAGVATDAEGNAFITGYFNYNINFEGPSLSTNSKATFIAKYKTNGKFEWARKAEADESAPGDEGAIGICVDKAGDACITGTFTESIRFGNITLYTPAISFYITAYDRQGNVKWAKTPSGNYQAISSAIAADNSGNYFLAGNFSGDPAFDNISPAPRASLNGFMAKVVPSAVRSLTLVNAETDQDIQQINEGAEINTTALPTHQLNIRANLLPQIAAASVAFDFNGSTTLDNSPPFSIGGDDNGNYNAWQLPVGTHLLKVTPYTEPNAQGQALATYTVSFTVTEGTQKVISFTLVDISTGKDIGNLRNNEVLDLAKLPSQISIRANTDPEEISGSVKFDLIGSEEQLRSSTNSYPYAIAGTADGKYKPWNINTGGSYTLTAAPYTLANAQGTRGGELTIRFTVINSGNISPVVDAGRDTTLNAEEQPQIISLNGAAYDPDGEVTSYQWTQRSGPSQSYIYDPTAPSTLLSELKAGTYVFRFTVTDNFGAVSFDEVTVTVRSGQSPTKVIGFTLINADTEEDIATLSEGYLLDYKHTGTQNINIRANTASAAGSIIFKLNQSSKTANNAPYTLAGAEVTGNKIDYLPFSPALDSGAYTLTATPYTEPDGQGIQGEAFTVNFYVTSGKVVLATPATNPPATHLTAYPNPFTDRVTLEFTVAKTGNVSLAVYDLQGRFVSELYSGPAVAASVNKVEFDGSRLPAGIYISRLTTGNHVSYRKLILSR